MTPGKQRQAEYRARMLAEGRRQYSFWLTDQQAAEIRAYLAGESSLLTPAQPEKAPKPARSVIDTDTSPPRIVHYRYINRPLCGQRDSRGKGWARGNYSTEIKDVTCKKCRHAFEKQQEQGTPQPLPGKITIRPGQRQNEIQVLRDGKHIGSVYKRRVDGYPRAKTHYEAYRYGRILPLDSYRTKREAVAALSG